MTTEKLQSLTFSKLWGASSSSEWWHLSRQRCDQQVYPLLADYLLHGEKTLGSVGARESRPALRWRLRCHEKSNLCAASYECRCSNRIEPLRIKYWHRSIEMFWNLNFKGAVIVLANVSWMFRIRYWVQNFRFRAIGETELPIISQALEPSMFELISETTVSYLENSEFIQRLDSKRKIQR